MSLRTIDGAPRAAPPPPPVSVASSGADLVARATSATGRVDTAQLARWVADAARTSPQAASSAHAAIEAKLGAGDAGRFNADVATAFRAQQAAGRATHSATGVALIPGVSGGRILRDNPILEIQWRTTTSPVTNRSGFSKPLQNLLNAHGIRTDFPVHAKPVGGTTSNAPGANTRNGNAARDAIAAQLTSGGRYSHVGTEATENTDRKTSLGGRRVDVVAASTGHRPEGNKTIEIESKLGRASASQDTRLQVAKDGERIVENVKVRRIGSTLRSVGKVVRPMGMAHGAARRRVPRWGRWAVPWERLSAASWVASSAVSSAAAWAKRRWAS